MDQQNKAGRVGACAVICALVIRMFAAGIPGQALELLRETDIVSIPKYLETGRYVRSSFSEAELPELPPESAEPVFRETVTETSPPISGADADLVQITDLCGAGPDIEKLLDLPDIPRLRRDTPTVLILHTHATESYTRDGEDYTEHVDYRTLDDRFNMVSIGDRVAERLENGGIHVIHDRGYHDYPNYTSAYSHARKSIRSILAENPDIVLVLDLHRDAAGSGRQQLRTCVQLGDDEGAQLMFVMGTDRGSLSHPDWQRNLALALKLYVIAEKQCPGIMRPLSLRSQRFNQDLSPGALLVEIGAAGNTRREALSAADTLADAILVLTAGETGKVQ